MILNIGVASIIYNAPECLGELLKLDTVFLRLECKILDGVHSDLQYLHAVHHLNYINSIKNVFKLF